MATATKNVVEVPDPPYTVTLELTQEEAEHLRWALGEMAGINSFYAVFTALVEAGITPVRPEKNPFYTVDTAPFND